MPQLLTRALIVASLLCTFTVALAQTLTPMPLFLAVAVSDIGTDNSLATSNTSRKLAIAVDGTLYALFRSATNGIRVARSNDRGQSFGASVQVAAVNAEAELAIGSDGDLHVAWVTGGSISHSISRDGGASFATPDTVGAGASSIHMAIDGDRVYIVPRNGSVVYRSSDDGVTFAQTSTGSSYAFADIFVDPLTRDVLVIVDNPSVFFFVSTDFGETFTGPSATGKSVFFSVGALAVTGANRYLFLAGSGTNLERVEVDTPAFFTATVAATAGSTTRSLSADVFGNVVSGYLEAGTNDLKFQHSNDLAANLGAATTVVNSATHANAAINTINTINGDILFLYEKSNQIFLSTYERGLTNYDINVAPSSLNFGAVELNAQASLPLTLTNVGVGPVAVTAITASTDFSVAHDCGANILAGTSCTATVTFAPGALGTASGTVTMTLDGVTRQLPLSGTAIPVRLATTTQLDTSATTADVGDSITLNALVTGSAVTGTVSFTEVGTAIAGCSAVAVAGAAASCTVSGLTAGLKQYSAAYSGDIANISSTSNVITIAVGSFEVTPSAAAGGSLDPGTPQTAVFGDTVAFTVEPDTGYRVDTVSGCGGALSGTTYTTGPVTADCAVTATFALLDLAVTPGAASGGSLSPGTPQSVLFGSTAVFTVVPNSGFLVSTVSGCGGSLSGLVYTTGSITADCTVTATFAPATEEVEVVAKSKGGGGTMSWLTLLLGMLGVLARRGMLPLLMSFLALGRASAEESRWVVGGALGEATGEQGSSDVARSLAQRGFAAGGVTVGNLDRTAYRLFAGYYIKPYWVVEAGYTDLGDVATSTNATVPIGHAPAYARALLASLPVSASGYEASLGYRYLFAGAFAVVARAGIWRWENEQHATFGNQRVSASPTGTDALFGLAIEWRFAKQWAVGAEASRYRSGAEDLDVLAANVKFTW